MSELQNEIFQKVQEQIAFAIHHVETLPASVSNPQLIVLTDLAKAQAQLASLGEIQGKVNEITTQLHGLYEHIGGFLLIETDRHEGLEVLRAEGAEIEASIQARLASAEKPETESEDEGLGQKYRDTARKEIAKLHSGVSNKGSGCFQCDGGGYYVGYFQKSGSSDGELKFSVSISAVDWLKDVGGSIYLVGKDGLAVKIAVDQLADRQITSSRWEFFVTIEQDAVSGVTGNRRAFALEFETRKLDID